MEYVVGILFVAVAAALFMLFRRVEELAAASCDADHVLNDRVTKVAIHLGDLSERVEEIAEESTMDEEEHFQAFRVEVRERIGKAKCELGDEIRRLEDYLSGFQSHEKRIELVMVGALKRYYEDVQAALRETKADETKQAG